MTPRSVKRAQILADRQMHRSWRKWTRAKVKATAAMQDDIRKTVARQLAHYDSQEQQC